MGFLLITNNSHHLFAFVGGKTTCQEHLCQHHNACLITQKKLQDQAHHIFIAIPQPSSSNVDQEFATGFKFLNHVLIKK
jgi:hypothetical protein